MNSTVTIILGLVALIVVWVAVIAWYRKEKKKKAQAELAATKPTAKTADGTVKPTEKTPEDKKKSTWI